ncbi:MAG: type IX secretion system sortase PorU [Bacteroidales bacterium]
MIRKFPKLKRICSFLIFVQLLFSLYSVHAQGNHQHSFNWTPVQTVTDSSNSVSFQVLGFDEAEYNLRDSYLPFFREVLPLPSNEFEMDVKISNETYDSLAVSSLQNVSGINEIKDRLRRETQKHSMRKQAYGSFKIYPLKISSDGNYIKLLQSFSYSIHYKFRAKNTNKAGHQYADNSVLSTGEWHKLRISRSGIYKITYEDLNNYGLDVSSLDPSEIQIYGNGGQQLPYNNSTPNPDDLIENAIYVSAGNNGRFDPGDYILFYAQGPVTWNYNYSQQRFMHSKHEYDKHAYYYLTYGQNQGKRIQNDTSSPGTANIFTSSYDSYQYHEKDSVNLLKSGRRFFGETFDIQTSYNYRFNFPDLDPASPVKFIIAVAARSTQNTSFALDINGNSRSLLVPAIPGNYNSWYAKASRDTFSLNIQDPQINFQVSYNKPQSSATGWMDYIQVNAREQLVFRDQQLAFRDVSATGNGNIAAYTINNASSGVKVWEINDAQNPVNMNTHLNGDSLTFKATADTLRNFIAHKNDYLSPRYVGTVENQNLHSLPQPDMVIVTHPELSEQADEIAELHKDKDKMTVHVVEPAKIYNEFSSGQQDVTAIRNFMRMFYERASTGAELPRYLLLMGDGNYDPKNRNDYNKATMITFQSSSSIHPAYTYVTDDYFGMYASGEGVNAIGDLDIGIGRIPANSVSQARTAITKMKRYLNLDTATMNADLQQNPSLKNSLGDWRNTICFIADDEDNNTYVTQADKIATKLSQKQPVYNLNKIYFDAYQQVSTPGGQRYPEVNKAINEQVQKGALIINYIGHGGPAGLAHEEVLRINDINNWKNKYNLPVFMTATCEFSRFDDPGRESAGERAFHHTNGGAISLFTTSRLAFAGQNAALNQSFYNNLFKKQNGAPLRMGDAMMYAKLGASSSPGLKNFVLLGNPALNFAFPEKNVSTTSINGKDTSFTDTIQALSEITVKGAITNHKGNIDTTFNGIIYPTVFDKKNIYHTLGQDPSSHQQEFGLRDKILHKGKSSVKNGHFSFTFFVPKDIDYHFGKGKISYYAEDGINDAHGYFNDFIIGGTSDSAATDTTGPEISLYMNDFSFVSGGMTDENPLLLARVYDEHGINTVGSGIGHDIVAVLNENTNQQYILNDYYEADLNDFTKGTIRYPFNDLPEGRHTLTVKVWDNFNNSSQATIEFVVTKSENITLKNLKAYPNPSDGDVWFTFNHNQASSEMDFRIDIFTLEGRRIETLQTDIIAGGYSVEPLKWNGRTRSGNPVKGGMYIYRATIRTPSGISKQKSGKIVILDK